MRTTIQLLGGLAAATTLLLSSCGDNNTASNNPETPPETPTSAAYPLDVCVVSGEKLGSMGKPHVVTHKGTEVRLCCEECLPKFNKNPDKFVAMLETEKSGAAEHTDHSGHKH